MQKFKKKKNQRIKRLTIVIGLLICCCITLTILLFQKIFTKEIYEVESRVTNIEEKNKVENETIGWLKVQGTNIDTPIIRSDSEKVKNSDVTESFLWNENSTEKLFNKVNIMGHNIMNLSSKPIIDADYFTRFEDLMSFVYPSFVEENKYIQYTIDNKDYVYKVFAVLFTKQYKLDVYSQKDYSEEQLKEYIEFVKEESIYDFKIDVNEKDKIISLITCTRLFGSDTKKEFVVVGRLVRDDEKLRNYDFKENSNYKKIETIMEGDEENEKA